MKSTINKQPAIVYHHSQQTNTNQPINQPINQSTTNKLTIHTKTQQLYDSIIEGSFKFLKPWWDEISDGAKDLVTHLLCTDPELRYTPKQVFDHPWMKGSLSHAL